MGTILKISEQYNGNTVDFTYTVPAGRTVRMHHVTAHLSAAPTTSESYTITLDADAGVAFDTLVYSSDLSATSATDVVWYPDGWEWLLSGGDQIEIDFANSDTATIGVELTIEAL